MAQLIGIEPEAFEMTARYLESRPYKEVAAIIDGLKKAVRVETNPEEDENK